MAIKAMRPASVVAGGGGCDSGVGKIGSAGEAVHSARADAATITAQRALE